MTPKDATRLPFEEARENQNQSLLPKSVPAAEMPKELRTTASSARTAAGRYWKTTDRKEISYMARKTVNLPPAPAKTMAGFAQGGYSLDTAVADIIDNSINARAKNVWIEIATDLGDNPLVYIWDDGYGMSEQELQSAMQYGSVDHESGNELGRFGLGLKAASTAISRSLDVISRRGPTEPLIGANWDMDRVAAENEWSLEIGDPTDEHREYFRQHLTGAGTLVAWEKVYSICAQGEFNSQRKSRMVKNLREHLGRIFHRFIERGQVNLYVNTDAVEPWNPIPENEPDLEEHFKDIIPLELSDGEQSDILLGCYSLPSKEAWSSAEERDRHGMKSATKFQGIYVYREDRMIVCGEWLGLGGKEPHANLSRHTLDLDRTMDSTLQINYQKNTLSPPLGLMEVLGQIIVPFRKAAEAKYRDTTRHSIAARNTARHSESSNLIKENYEAVNGSNIQVQDNNTARVTKVSGTMVIPIRVEADALLMDTAETLDNGYLWEPRMTNGQQGVILNKSHPFYQRVYVPLMNSGIATKGLDMVFWSLASLSYDAEFDLSEHQMDDLIELMTRKLKRLARTLPEPILD